MINFRKHIIFWLILSILFNLSACEEIYNPHLNNVNNYLSIEARLYADRQYNNILIYKSKKFGSTSGYEVVSGAVVSLTDDEGKQIYAHETDTAGTYCIENILNPDRRYYLAVKIENEEYISGYQSVPNKPLVDTVYGAFEYATFTSGTSNSTTSIITKRGIRLFADMSYNNKLSHYRFAGREILQFHVSELSRTIFYWKSYYPSGLFNIAGPPNYSNQQKVTSHKLVFFIENYYEFIDIFQTFDGWIYIIDIYGLNEDTYNYYQKLNNQLDTEGKIFDPVFVQVKGNINCKTSPEVVVFGNFEISSHKEYRYFVNYTRNYNSFTIKKIPYFYDIPENGEVIVPPDSPPDFWERTKKNYPDD